MGRGRARAAVIGALLSLLALGAFGCGAESHPNKPRPQVSTRVSITVGPNEVIVTPARIAIGPEKTQQIPQNQGQPQPPIRGDERPLNVVFVTANQTDTDSKIELRGPSDADSGGPVFAHSPGSFQADLPSGKYVITAPGIPGAKAAKLTVGEYRASSENDVLLP